MKDAVPGALLLELRHRAPPYAKFCVECGQRGAALEEAMVSPSPEAYTPKHITERIIPEAGSDAEHRGSAATRWGRTRRRLRQLRHSSAQTRRAPR